MAKINLIKNNFTSGELSPHIWMRTDLQQYRNGTKEIDPRQYRGQQIPLNS